MVDEALINEDITDSWEGGANVNVENTDMWEDEYMDNVAELID